MVKPVLIVTLLLMQSSFDAIPHCALRLGSKILDPMAFAIHYPAWFLGSYAPHSKSLSPF